MLEIGRSAPPFRLPDHDGKDVSLRDLAGRWVVLYFYPKDDTPGCTVEACEFTAALPDFSGLGAEVFGCSADPASAHQKFIAKHRLGIRLLTDADRKVMRAYGAFGKKVLYGKAIEGVIRSTVLIDPAGRVACHWPVVKAAGHAAVVRQKLVELQSGSVVIPAAKPVRRAARKATSKSTSKATSKATRKATKKAGSKASPKSLARSGGKATKKRVGKKAVRR